MATGRQLIGSFGVLLAIQALTSLVAIGLLGRMGPAIEHIMQDNVYSVEAVEDMLAVIARPGPASPELRRAYAEALERAKSNVTDPEEREPLSALERPMQAALAGDLEARAESAEALRRLGRVNRLAMQRADDEARRLGIAGAWAAAFLGFAGLAASLLAMARARRRILSPVAEMARVVRAHQEGEPHRRCAVPAGTVPELARVMDELDRLYDVEESARVPAPASDLDRRALLHLLDARDEPTVILDADGRVAASNRAADDVLAGEDGARLRDALRQAKPGATDAGLVRVEPLGETGATMCVLAFAR